MYRIAEDNIDNYIYKYPSYQLEKIFGQEWLIVIGTTLFGGIGLGSIYQNAGESGVVNLFALILCYALLIGGIALALWIILSIILRQIHKRYGTYFDDKCVQFKYKDKVLHEVDYKYYFDEIKAGNYGYDRASLYIGEGENRINFWYEVGFKFRQDAYVKSYKKFIENIRNNVSWDFQKPIYTRSCQNLFDKDFFYDKKKLHTSVSLILSMLFLLFIVEVNFINPISIIPIAVWQAISIIILYKYTLCSEKNKEKLMEEFEDIEHLEKTFTVDQFWVLKYMLIITIAVDIVITLIPTSIFF